MTPKERREAIRRINIQLNDGYLDLGLYDQHELEIIKEAVHAYCQYDIYTMNITRCKDCVFSREVDDVWPTMYRCVNPCRDGCTQWVSGFDFCSYGYAEEK